RLQPDGKIVVVGTDSTGAIARYNADGSPDTSFGGGTGKVVADLVSPTGPFDSPSDVLVQADGKVLVAGLASDPTNPNRKTPALARFLPNGTVNFSFGTAGRLTTDVVASAYTSVQMVAQPDGKVLVVSTATGTPTGNDFLTARFTTDDTFTTDNQRYV